MTVETIVAIATPPGPGGIGILRLSGPLSLSIAETLTRKKEIKPRYAHYCSFYGSDSSLMDKGLLVYFKAPHSFTGDDVVECQVHGSPIVLDGLLRETVRLGARLAGPGEFSFRAFQNDLIDLTQAEAIADLISAHSQTAARMALRSLQGEFSKKINELNEKIIHLRLYVEAAIDFPEEEIDFINDGNVAALLSDVLKMLEAIRAHATQGVMMREGLSVVIAGRPNAGKSTLINALSGRDIAIVTAIPGTTRDVMRQSILLDDIPLHLIDTAGLRDSEDEVEKEGIARAWKEVRQADCLLLVIDVTQPLDEWGSLSDAIQKERLQNIPIIRVYNKIDKLARLPKIDDDGIYISAKAGEGLPILKAKIKEVVGYHPMEGQFLARRRHLDALDTTHQLLLNGQDQLTFHRAGELLAEDLRLAHQSLCEITGEFSSDDLLGKIFSSFCIGK